MQKINVISLFPKFIESYLEFGVLKSAIDKSIIDFKTIDLRDFAVDKRGTVDDRPYGGGDGMILRPEPIFNAVESTKEENPFVIYTSPAGKPFEQSDVEKLKNLNRPLTFLCGRYGGVDQRVIDNLVDETYSIGNFVLSGGELAVLSIIDSLSRSLDGVLGSNESYLKDSFTGEYEKSLEPAQYTRPEVYKNHRVPDVLLSGDHAKIEKWQKDNSIKLTNRLKPNLSKLPD